MQIINGKKIAEEILTKIKSEVATLPFTPVFCDILVGEDPSSVQYVKMKANAATSVGIKFHTANFPSAITTDELVKEIKLLNKIENMCGIIAQLPLEEHIDKRAILDAISPDLDVDCLGVVASNKFYDGENALGFPSAMACMTVLDSLNLDLKNKNIVVLGQGDLVGRPVTALLKFRGLDPKIIRSKTEGREKLIKDADVIISGIGKGKYITGDMVKDGAVLIDAGTSESNGSIVGDIDLESVKEIAGFISPVPGGVGPVTVATLLNNVLIVAKNLNKNKHE
ncbi:MAG: bifunctional 5,10-methylenetetrahydrofolate dehydrogenase/5,10-methenyltetrahydrofolate cyclohydrolase [Patescibacteria group bacterium]|nr:bifunctional 5,10-methylenetetrahydrofolate dehydrogenase/5,10-methenyltetrahydrofolate cyclohydrolase [Patescibacteria group bacterium]